MNKLPKNCLECVTITPEILTIQNNNFDIQVETLTAFFHLFATSINNSFKKHFEKIELFLEVDSFSRMINSSFFENNLLKDVSDKRFNYRKISVSNSYNLEKIFNVDNNVLKQNYPLQFYVIFVLESIYNHYFEEKAKEKLQDFNLYVFPESLEKDLLNGKLTLESFDQSDFMLHSKKRFLESIRGLCKEDNLKAFKYFDIAF